MPELRRPDVTLHYETHGAGEPVLFVMGLGADSGGWAPQVRAVAPGRMAIVVDNRGIGRSTRARRLDYSIDATTADAAALLEHLDVGPAHVVGISLGGVVAQRLAVGWPERVRSLVLAASFAKAPRGVYVSSLKTAARITRWLLDPRPAKGGDRIARAVLKGWMPSVFSEAFARDNEPLLREMILGAIGRSVRVEVSTLQLLHVLRHDARADLGRVTAPALVLCGDRDAAVPRASSEELARLLPDARLEVLEGGHGLNVEAAEAFNRAMLEFFALVERR